MSGCMECWPKSCSCPLTRDQHQSLMNEQNAQFYALEDKYLKIKAKAEEMAALFIEIHGVDKERLDGFGPGEVDLQLLAEDIIKNAAAP